MLSQLLRHEANSLARQQQQQQQQHQQHHNNHHYHGSPNSTSTSPQQSHPPHHSPTLAHPNDDASMAASVASMPVVGTAMQDSDEHRPDLPRPYKCPLCDKAFHRLEHQTRHIRTHTGEKPHACQFPGCTKRFSRSDELTRHSRIHSNPNSRRGNKQHVAAAHAAAAAIQGGMYDSPAMQHVNPLPHLQPSPNHTQNHMGQSHQAPPMNPTSPMPSLNQVTISSGPMHAAHPMPPPPSLPQSTRSAPGSQTTSPNITPPHSFANYPTHPGSYTTRNIGGDLSPAQGPHHPPMDINLLATAASQVERENNKASYLPNQSLSLPARRQYHHNTPYHTGRMPSLSSYHYSSNPTSQPMSRSHSEEEQYGHRLAKKSKPNTPQSTAPPSPEFPNESTSPTPDHTPLATPSHSPRLRPQYFHNGMQLPTLNHLTLMNQPPPALAPVEPSADGLQPYIPTQHSGLRISEIMEAGDGAQRKLPIPMVSSKDSSYTKIHELMNPDSGPSSGRGSEAGNDLFDRH